MNQMTKPTETKTADEAKETEKSAEIQKLVTAMKELPTSNQKCVTCVDICIHYKY